ncbi:hypothetical protein QFZ55_000219 [Streptomyces luteogriseus]|nr:hypothetical protein [Streptomyces luteogriseus]
MRHPQRRSIYDLRGYNLNDQPRPLKINRSDCG